MPELPEVETVRRGLDPVLAGATIDAVDQRRPDLRFPFPPDSPRGSPAGASRRSSGAPNTCAPISTTRRCSSFISGCPARFASRRRTAPSCPASFHHPRSSLAAHDHVVLTLSNGARVVYNDPRRFGFMLLVDRAALDTHPLFARLGVEPLGDGLDGAALARLFAGRATALKAALLDQTLIGRSRQHLRVRGAASAGLSPRRAAGTLARRDGGPTPRATRLAQVIREVLEEAVSGGGSSLRDHRQTDGSLGYFQHTFRVYDREEHPCPSLRCSGVVRRIVQNGRSTFFCSTCQR